MSGLDLEKAINQYETNPNVVRASKNLLIGIPEERGDGFDDIAEGSRFYSSPARTRWAAAQVLRQNRRRFNFHLICRIGQLLDLHQRCNYAGTARRNPRA